jgi:hypothetical protein
MLRGDFIGQKAVRLGFKLIHHNAENAPAFFPRAARSRFHDAQITARADGKSGFRQPRAEVFRLLVFGRIFRAARAAENGDNSFFAHNRFTFYAILVSRFQDFSRRRAPDLNSESEHYAINIEIFKNYSNASEIFFPS